MMEHIPCAIQLKMKTDHDDDDDDDARKETATQKRSHRTTVSVVAARRWPGNYRLRIEKKAKNCARRQTYKLHKFRMEHQ